MTDIIACSYENKTCQQQIKFLEGPYIRFACLQDLSDLGKIKQNSILTRLELVFELVIDNRLNNITNSIPAYTGIC